MDAPLVRGFLLSLDDRVDEERTVVRVRAYLEALGRPDVRYLVGLIRGAGADTVTRYARGVLTAAGASVQGPDDPLDDPLLARSGTSVATIAYQLAATRPELGEVSRREAAALIRFVAAAEASRRVVLLVDEALAEHDPVLGVTPDVIAVAGARTRELALTGADVPDGKLVVLARRDAASIEDLERAAKDRNVTFVLGGRDFIVESGGLTMDLAVGDERYTGLALGAGDDPELAAAGIVTALALGAFGVRMRPEWVESGAHLAAARELTA